MRLIAPAVLLFAIFGVAAAQDTNFATGPQYLMTTDAMLLRPISTPSLSFNAPLPPVPQFIITGIEEADVSYVPNPNLQGQADLFPIYYGYPQTTVVELVSPEETPELPGSITGAGFGGETDAQTLREMGYGVPLGDAALYWKTHRLQAPRVYTNADTQKFHQS
jgi:hypothetical protein